MDDPRKHVNVIVSTENSKVNTWSLWQYLFAAALFAACAFFVTGIVRKKWRIARRIAQIKRDCRGRETETILVLIHVHRNGDACARCVGDADERRHHAFKEHHVEDSRFSAIGARSNFEQNAKKIVSYTIVLLMIVITASCASMAYLVRYLATASFLLSVVISPPRPKNFILPLCVLVLRLAHTRVGWWL